MSETARRAFVFALVDVVLLEKDPSEEDVRTVILTAKDVESGR
jgi:hypothetical protein